jgi:Uma2 family endonuclease
MDAQESVAREIIGGQIVATGVSAEDYLAHYAEQHCEWIKGVVIKMSPIHEKHDLLTRYLSNLLATYFELNPIGRIRQDPFVMRLSEVEAQRQPDIQVILESNPHPLKPTYMDGPADICIEVVSPGSMSIDRGDKFAEYEKGGVGEYWIIDPIHEECLFYRLGEAGYYVPYSPDAAGHYHTPLLPGLKLQVTTLWQEQLPGPIAVAKAVQSMLSDGV